MIRSFRPLNEGVQVDDLPPHSTYYNYAYEQENEQRERETHTQRERERDGGSTTYQRCNVAMWY